MSKFYYPFLFLILILECCNSRINSDEYILNSQKLLSEILKERKAKLLVREISLIEKNRYKNQKLNSRFPETNFEVVLSDSTNISRKLNDYLKNKVQFISIDSIEYITRNQIENIDVKPYYQISLPIFNIKYDEAMVVVKYDCGQYYCNYDQVCIYKKVKGIWKRKTLLEETTW